MNTEPVLLNVTIKGWANDDGIIKFKPAPDLTECVFHAPISWIRVEENDCVYSVFKYTRRTSMQSALEDGIVLSDCTAGNPEFVPELRIRVHAMNNDIVQSRVNFHELSSRDKYLLSLDFAEIQFTFDSATAALCTLGQNFMPSEMMLRNCIRMHNLSMFEAILARVPIRRNSPMIFEELLLMVSAVCEPFLSSVLVHNYAAIPRDAIMQALAAQNIPMVVALCASGFAWPSASDVTRALQSATPQHHSSVLDLVYTSMYDSAVALGEQDIVFWLQHGSPTTLVVDSVLTKQPQVTQGVWTLLREKRMWSTIGVLFSRKIAIDRASALALLNELVKVVSSTELSMADVLLHTQGLSQAIRIGVENGLLVGCSVELNLFIPFLERWCGREIDVHNPDFGRVKAIVSILGRLVAASIIHVTAPGAAWVCWNYHALAIISPPLVYHCAHSISLEELILEHEEEVLRLLALRAIPLEKPEVGCMLDSVIEYRMSYDDRTRSLVHLLSTPVELHMPDMYNWTFLEKQAEELSPLDAKTVLQCVGDARVALWQSYSASKRFISILQDAAAAKSSVL